MTHRDASFNLTPRLSESSKVGGLRVHRREAGFCREQESKHAYYPAGAQWGGQSSVPLFRGKEERAAGSVEALSPCNWIDSISTDARRLTQELDPGAFGAGIMLCSLG